MLETLVSSRIRRTLLEYILTHSTGQFYLRGLAKDLNLSISPLRRELARLEQSGMLTAVEEGNIRFYRVNTATPQFLQLQQAAGSSPAVTMTAAVAAAPPMERLPSRPLLAALVSPLRTPALLGAAVVGMLLMAMVAGLFYLTLTNDRLASSMRRVLTARSANVTVVVPQPSASGTMRGRRWQVVPGGFGGFSSGGSNESY